MTTPTITQISRQTSQWGKQRPIDGVIARFATTTVETEGQPVASDAQQASELPERSRVEMSTSTVQKITSAFGLVYLLIGVLGFVPGITRFESDPMGSVPGEGLLLGIFAVNVVHNVAHLALGAILVWGSRSAARVGAVDRLMAAVFLILVVASVIAPIVEGVAINPPDTVLHLASALLTGYLGFVATRQTAASRV